jgi:ABC-type multidrug transport system fused ATPase/permease subunit
VSKEIRDEAALGSNSGSPGLRPSSSTASSAKSQAGISGRSDRVPAAEGRRDVLTVDAIRTEGLHQALLGRILAPPPYVALDGLDLQVGQGEVFGLPRPNGAGKTTTLKLLMQLIFPTSGRAEILGRPVGDVAVRRRIGYLPENPFFYDNLSAEELLTYFAALSAITAARAPRVRGCSTRSARRGAPFPAAEVFERDAQRVAWPRRC